MPEETARAAERRLAKRFEWPDANGDGAGARSAFARQAADRFGRTDGFAGEVGEGGLARREIASGIRRGG